MGVDRVIRGYNGSRAFLDYCKARLHHKRGSETPAHGKDAVR